MGAELNAGTGKETTSVYSRVLDQHLRARVRRDGRHGLAPGASRDVETEREVVLEEIAMYEDDPQDKVFDVLGEAVFGDHPLGRAVIGRARGHPPRAAPSSSPPSTTRATCRATSSSPPPARSTTTRSSRSSRAQRRRARRRARAGARRRRRTPRRAAPCASIGRTPSSTTCALGAPGIARDDDRRFALRVLDTVLGGTSSSRLFQEVREKRGAGLQRRTRSTPSTPDTGQVGLYLGTRPDNLGDGACRSSATSCERFLRGPASPTRSSSAPRRTSRAARVLSLESTSARMNRLGGSLLADCPLLSRRRADRAHRRGHARRRASSSRASCSRRERLCAAGSRPDEDAFRAALEPVMPALAEAA